jgi:hypothetical protein
MRSNQEMKLLALVTLGFSVVLVIIVQLGKRSRDRVVMRNEAIQKLKRSGEYFFAEPPD